VIQTGIVVVGTAQHHDADAILALELVQNLAGSPADAGFVFRQRLVAGFDRAIVFFPRQSENRPPCLEHLTREQLAVGEVQHGGDVLYVVFGEDVVLFRERSLHSFRRGGNRRARIGAVKNRDSFEIEERAPVWRCCAEFCCS